MSSTQTAAIYTEVSTISGDSCFFAISVICCRSVDWKLSFCMIGA